jgi:ferritin
MNQRVVEAINRQINSELSASYSYLAMSAWCERQKFVGAARWLRLQSQEEHMHAMKLLDFLLARDCDVKFLAIQAPQAPYASLLDVFERALEQVEEEKTGREIVAKLKMVGTDAASIIDMDRELGARTAEPAPPATT